MGTWIDRQWFGSASGRSGPQFRCRRSFGSMHLCTITAASVRITWIEWGVAGTSCVQTLDVIVHADQVFFQVLEALARRFWRPRHFDCHRWDVKLRKSINPSSTTRHERWSARIFTTSVTIRQRNVRQHLSWWPVILLHDRPLNCLSATRARFGSISYGLIGTHACAFCWGDITVLLMLELKRRVKFEFHHLTMKQMYTKAGDVKVLRSKHWWLTCLLL